MYLTPVLDEQSIFRVKCTVSLDTTACIVSHVSLQKKIYDTRFRCTGAELGYIGGGSIEGFVGGHFARPKGPAKFP
jgi:hypothetical protein